MKEIKLYQCGICHTQYADRNECKRREAAHKQNLVKANLPELCGALVERKVI